MVTTAVLSAGSLPQPRTPLIGRASEREMARAFVLDDAVPLLTLTGPGGVGKTRLALAIALDMAPSCADGVVWVDLAPLADAGLVPDTVAAALGVPTSPERLVIAAITAHLRRARCLLLLDNCEHVVTAAADLVSALLAGCPAVQVLATSRAPLRVQGEQILSVPPLPLTATSATALDDVPAAPAVAFFVQRARTVDPRFTLTAANAGPVVQICQHLDGLPLAIELAAARTSVLSPAALLALLSQRLQVLGRGPRDAPMRQQTMRDAIAWSYDLLSLEEQTAFRRLAVFAGGWSLEAAAAMSDCSLPAALELLATLVEQSLVVRGIDPAAEAPRFMMLETIREFGLEQLAASGETEAITHRHAAYFTTFAEVIARPMEDLIDLESAPPRLDVEQDNLRAALVWADERDEDALLMRLAVALRVHWFVRGRLREGRAWVDRAALAASREDIPTTLRATAFLAAGWYARRTGNNGRAEMLGQESLALFQTVRDAANAAEALELLGRAAEDRQDFHLAQARHTEELALLAPLDKPIRVAMAMRNVGWTSYLAGDAVDGERRLEDALAACQRLGYHHGAAAVMSDLATVAMERGEHSRAAALLHDKLTLTWDAWGLRHTIEQLAEVAAACGESARAARLFGAAEAFRDQIGSTLAPSTHARYEPYVAMARATLGHDAFSAAWAAGRLLSLDEARAEAAQVAQAPASVHSPDAVPNPVTYGLTAREMAVLRLLVEGHSDREIAEALFITYRTATSYVRNILTKLNVSSRTAAATYAVRHGLI